MDVISITVITNIKKAKDYLSLNSDNLNADEIYYVIRKFYEKPLIYKLLSGFYPNLTKEEVKNLYESVKSLTVSERYKTKIESIIKGKLNDYFLYNDILNIEGFIKFRLNAYISVLVDIILVCAEEYVIEKEYNEFIALLQKYVMLQDSLFDKIEVLLLNNGFTVYDAYGNDITNYCIKNFLIDDLIEIARPEDLLLNLLIVTAPKEIIIYNAHKNAYRDFLNTVKKIFNKSILIINSNQTDF